METHEAPRTAWSALQKSHHVLMQSSSCFNAKFIIFNAKFIIFNAKFIILYRRLSPGRPKIIILSALTTLMFNHQNLHFFVKKNKTHFFRHLRVQCLAAIPNKSFVVKNSSFSMQKWPLYCEFWQRQSKTRFWSNIRMDSCLKFTHLFAVYIEKWQTVCVTVVLNRGWWSLKLVVFSTNRPQVDRK